MGLPWIKVAVDLPDHPKLDVLEGLLELWEGFGIAVMNRLWCWTARLYPDGVIPQDSWLSMTRKCVRNAPSVTGTSLEISPEKFVDALRVSRFGVLQRGSLVLHDWDEFQSAHARKAEQNRDRQRHFRERQALLSNADGNEDVTHPVTHVTPLDGEEKRRDRDQDQKKEREPAELPEGFHHEPWDTALLKAVQESLKLDDLDTGWGQFVGQSLWEPAEKRHAAAREFLHRRCAANGKDWPYLLSMIRNGAGLKTQPSRSVEAPAQSPAEIAKVRAELAEIKRQGMAPRSTRP